MSILNSTERLPATRISQATNVLAAASSNVPVNIAPLTYVSGFRVVSVSVGDVMLRAGTVTETAIGPLVAGQDRLNVALDALYLSSVTGGTVVLELWGR